MTTLLLKTLKNLLRTSYTMYAQKYNCAGSSVAGAIHLPPYWSTSGGYQDRYGHHLHSGTMLLESGPALMNLVDVGHDCPWKARFQQDMGMPILTHLSRHMHQLSTSLHVTSHRL